MAVEQSVNLAQTVLQKAAMPFEVVSRKVLPDQAEVTVVHRAGNLEGQMHMTGTASRKNGETDDVLLFTALAGAVGNPAVTGAEYHGKEENVETGNVVVSFRDGYGMSWKSEAPGFQQAATEGLAAAVVLDR